jgi:hypothetical protein
LVVTPQNQQAVQNPHFESNGFDDFPPMNSTTPVLQSETMICPSGNGGGGGATTAVTAVAAAHLPTSAFVSPHRQLRPVNMPLVDFDASVRFVSSSHSYSHESGDDSDDMSIHWPPVSIQRNVETEEPAASQHLIRKTRSRWRDLKAERNRLKRLFAVQIEQEKQIDNLLHNVNGAVFPPLAMPQADSRCDNDTYFNSPGLRAHVYYSPSTRRQRCELISPMSPTVSPIPCNPHAAQYSPGLSRNLFM